ncbi:MAG: NAD-dependent epimerase/dehydratase family protein [Candidatus Bipolaricaulia bacterium]
MSRRSLLITGAAGLIGGLLVNHFRDKYELRLLDRTAIAGEDTIVADISDLDAISDVFSGIDTVVHLAADPGLETPWEMLLPDNIIGTYHVFKAARRASVNKIIYASSNHVTGMYERVDPPLYRRERPPQIDHTVPIRPDSLYGVSKCFGEALGRFYAEEYGISVICLRIGSVLRDNDPSRDERFRSTWLSHRDLAQLVERCVEVEGLIFEIFYGVSNNTRQFWDISHVREILGYNPQDNADSVLAGV